MSIDPKYLFLVTIGCLVVALDQATKLYVDTHFHLGESIVVIPDYFNFTYVRNPGAAFGFLSDAHETFRRAFFLSMPPIAMFIIVWILRTVPSTDRLQVLSLSLVFGGAIGNYIDRVRFGYVIDFIDVHYKEIYAWPAFNIADSAIVGGVMGLSYILLKELLEQRKSAPSKASE